MIFDYSAKSFRREIYADYKAHRPDPPSDLIPQFGLIRQATRAFNLACVEQEGWEADDLIATYAKQAVETGAKVTIVSSDKDLMQLLRDGVSMVDTMKNTVIGREGVKEKFGVYPEKMIELQALVGDSTDNVPGVPGIGPKTAAQLLDEYGDLDTLLARAGEIKQQKRRENLVQFAEQARISRKLVTLSHDVPLDVPLNDLAVDQIDGPTAVAFCKALEFTALTKRVAEKVGVDPAEIAPAALEIAGWPPGGGAPAHGPDMGGYGKPAAPKPTILSGRQRSLPLEPESTPVPSSGRKTVSSLGTPQALADKRRSSTADLKINLEDYQCVRTLDELQKWVDAVRERGLVAIEVQTIGVSPMLAEICGIALAIKPGLACYVPLGHRASDGDIFGGGLEKDQIKLDDALEALRPMLENPAVLKIGQNIKDDWLVLSRHGIEMAPVDDTMLMSYALDAGAFSHGHGLGELVNKLLGHERIELKAVAGTGKDKVGFERVPVDKATSYAAEDSDLALRLWGVLKSRLPAERVTRVYERLERPMVPVLARMEQRGIKVDRQILSRLSGNFAQKAAAAEAEIYELAGQEFNIGSTKQLGDILYGKMGLAGGKKTKTGPMVDRCQSAGGFGA